MRAARRQEALVLTLGAFALGGCGGGGDKPAAKLEPARGEAVVLAPGSGLVTVRLPGRGAHDLEGPERVGAGTIVDATRGAVLVEAIGPGGSQHARYSRGAFKLDLKTADGAVQTRLVGGDLGKCRKAGRPGERRPVRKLFGDGKGNFRSSGRFAAATVRGTVWVVRDFCEGTQVGVRRGRVEATTLPGARGLAGRSVMLESGTDKPDTRFFAAGAAGASDD
jgi:hypothetical protein